MKKSIVDPNSNDASWTKYYLKAQDDRDKAALRAVLQTKEGKWIFSRILQITGIDTLSFTGNSFTYFKEGQREVGIQIKNLILSLGYEEGTNFLRDIDKERDDFTIRQNRIFNKED